MHSQGCEKTGDWGAVEKPNKLRQKRERSKKQGLGTRRFSACLYLLFTVAGLFQHPKFRLSKMKQASDPEIQRVKES